MTSTPFIKPMPIRVFNSDSLAMITSVGIHALLLGLLLPNLPNLNSSQKSASDQRDVEVIELTSAEVTRLPDQLPSLDMPDLLKNSPTDIPDLDSLSLPNTSNTLPAPPALPALPALPSLSSSYPSFSKPLPRPQRSLPIAPLQNFPSSRLPAPPQSNSEQENSQTATSQLPPVSQKPDFGPLGAPFPIDQLINQGRGNLPDTPTLQNSITSNSTPSQTAFNAEQARKDKLIGNLVRETIEGANNLRYNESNTTNEEARRNDARWMAKTGTPVTKRENWRTLRGNYPKAACLRRLEGIAIYGITVNPEGNIAKNPYLIKSSGYGVLNQQAFNQIKSASFSTNGQLQHYRVRISFSFDPKICPAVTQSPQNQQKKPAASETSTEPPKPTTDKKPKPTTLKTPTESPRPTADKKPEATIRGASTPETSAESPKPTIDKKPKPTTPPSIKNAPPFLPSAKK